MAHAVQTSCPLDCPDACSLRVEVEHGQLLRLDGDHRNPLTQGFICKKVRGMARHVHGEDRLRQPAVRVGPKGQGQWRTVSWDEALDRIAQRMREARDEHGGESILPLSYGGSNGVLTEGIMDARLFRRLGASHLERALCAAPSGRAHTGLYGKMPGVEPGDYVHARLVVCWGVNPSASSIHFAKTIKQAQAAGAKVVVIDPRRTPLAKRAALHLPVKPGADLPLALAVIRWLFEHERHDADFLARHATGVDMLRERAAPWTLRAAAEVTGLSVEDIEAFARLYADATPAVIRCGWGIERNRNGGSAVAAVLALPAVAGKFGVRGGGFTMSNSRAFGIDLEPVIAQPQPAVRSVNINHVGRVLTQEPAPPVKVLFVYDCNPVTTLPDQSRVRQGLMREDLFTVVFDQVMTDSAKLADVVLPATSFLEHDDLKQAYGISALQRIAPVIDRVGESRCNAEVFGALIERLGLDRDGDVGPGEPLLEAVLEQVDAPPGVVEGVRERGIEVARPAIAFVDRFPATDDGKIHLFPAALEAEAAQSGGLYRFKPDPGTTSHPLALISPAVVDTVSSTFGQLRRSGPRLLMHPDDAAIRGITDGVRVRVHNALGQMQCPVSLSDEVRPGVVCFPKGVWARHTLDGNTSNALCPPDLADLGGGATFNDARVEVEPID